MKINMKKNLFIVFFICLSLSVSTQGFADQERGKIIVEVDNFEHDQGFAFVSLCKPGDIFPPAEKQKPFARKIVKIENKKAIIIFEDIPFGTYAVGVFHDKNNNRRLDRNILGMPVEFYGFSNNARGIIGPPSFQEAEFELQKAILTIAITVK